MNSNNIIIQKCNVTIIGKKISIPPIGGKFRVVSFPIPLKYIEHGKKTKSLTGKITRANNSVGVENTKITAYKNGIMYDYDYTDKNGIYDLFLEDGIYDIKIENESNTKNVLNYKVGNGIKEYRKLITSGQIKEKYPIDTAYKNVVEFNSFSEDNKDRLINGVILDQHGYPVENAEIIIVDNSLKEVCAFVKTKKDGKYSLVLREGVYDVLLRSPKHHVKKIKNYSFLSKNGFLLDIFDKENNKYNIVFNNRGEWIWISS